MSHISVGSASEILRKNPFRLRAIHGSRLTLSHSRLSERLLRGSLGSTAKSVPFHPSAVVLRWLTYPMCVLPQSAPNTPPWRWRVRNGKLSRLGGENRLVQLPSLPHSHWAVDAWRSVTPLQVEAYDAMFEALGGRGVLLPRCSNGASPAPGGMGIAWQCILYTTGDLWSCSGVDRAGIRRRFYRTCRSPETSCRDA